MRLIWISTTGHNFNQVAHVLLRWSGFTLATKANDLLLGLFKKKKRHFFLLAGGAVHIKPPGGMQPVMLLSNLMGRKTIMGKLKVPASNNSTCLCAVGAFERWPCWRGFAGTPSHPWAWHRKQTVQLLQDQLELRQSEITEKKNKLRYEQQSYDDQIFNSDGDKTLMHTMYWPYCFNLVLMEMEKYQCGVQESGRLKFSLWRGLLKCYVHEYREKFTSQFLQTWKMLDGLNRKETCLTMWRIKHYAIKEHVFP